VLGAAYPCVSRRLLLTTNSPELTATLDNLLFDSQGRFNFDRLESLLEQAAKARVAALPANGGSSSSGVSSSSREARLDPLSRVAAAVGTALAGDQGRELLVGSLQLFSDGSGRNNSSSAGSGQQRVSGRGSAAAAAGGPLALVLSPEGAHIREILEDELAKGLDAAWRIQLDQTLDSAASRLEGIASLAAGTPLGSRLPPAPQQQQQQLEPQESAQIAAAGSDGAIVTGASSSSSNSRPDFIESLLSLPRLAGADDRAQVEGLTRLAVQLSALSPSPAPAAGPAPARGGSAVLSAQQPQQRPPRPLTPQQASNAAALQQVRQAAEVLRWLLSEVQLLSPEAQREALAIPLHIVGKFGSRLAARAVRAVLTPPTPGAAAGRRGSGGAVTAATARPGAAAVQLQPQQPAAAAAAAAAPVAVQAAVRSAAAVQAAASSDGPRSESRAGVAASSTSSNSSNGSKQLSSSVPDVVTTGTTGNGAEAADAAAEGVASARPDGSSSNGSSATNGSTSTSSTSSKGRAVNMVPLASPAGRS
jgi:hypothetical protein